jgi:sulfur relay (sulfurtransferase) DsrF/TusC family protein
MAEGNKNVLVVVTHSPSPAVGERLRMCVGLTLEDANKIRVLFTDDGVHSAVGIDRDIAGFDIDRHLEMLTMMQLPIYVHEPSVTSRGMTLDRKGITFVDDDATARLMAESDVILG